MATELVPALTTLTLLVGFCGLLLLGTKRYFARRVRVDDLEVAVNNLLPQVQCAQCGYAGCLPYARALIGGERTDLCPPGGASTAVALAELLNRPIALPQESFDYHKVARIDESECIGCKLCVNACPVDAIAGTEGFMHTVLAKYCTGCELCVAPCPVDCITMAATT